MNLRAHNLPKHTPCGYCYSEWATGWDHIVPVSAGGSMTDEANIIPCCKMCNSLKRDLIFDSLEDARTKLTQIRNKKAEHTFTPNR